MSTILLGLQAHLVIWRAGFVTSADERGQATAEYALVLLGAATLALLVVGWATKTNVVGHLLDAVFGQLMAKTKH